MKLGPGIRKLLRQPASVRAVERDVDAELEFHVATRTDVLMGRGLTRDAADEQARREFGDLRAARATRRTALHRSAPVLRSNASRHTFRRP